MTVVPESGMAPHGVCWPAFMLSREQNCTGAVTSPTEIPSKSRPQWKWPMEPRAPGTAGVSSRSTPSAPLLKHSEKRAMPARSRKPRPRRESASPDACGKPKPRMPSKGPLMERARSTISSRLSCIVACSLPTRTTSVAIMASIWPLPKVSTTALALCWPLGLVAELRRKDEDLLPPSKHLSDALHRCRFAQMQEATMTLSLPVSATTSNFCAGVPTSISIVKCVPRFRKGAQLPSSARSAACPSDSRSSRRITGDCCGCVCTSFLFSAAALPDSSQPARVRSNARAAVICGSRQGGGFGSRAVGVPPKLAGP
mmetsp:Transcript_18097/g.52725  ORF Transcript_18097/g.52725 Transcript_18097/m.52725 type:complete len:313 (-) Transcript_18097:26-964(-)